jgi:PEGA domain-containing protein
MSNLPEMRKRFLVAVVVLALALVVGGGSASAHSRVTIGFGAYFGFPAYYGYGGYYYPAQYAQYGPGVYYPSPERPYYAFVDTDIHPEEAQLYLDGRLIGIADDFDGYPGYLAVKPGRHVLLFQYRGYHSLSFTLSLRAGEVVDLDQSMVRLSAGQKEEPPPPPPPAAPESGSENPPSAERGAEGGRKGYGTLRLTVTPPEARVILDGDFFGTGAEISRLHGGIPLSAGTHRVRVNLAGYKTVAREAEIRESEEQTLDISLKKL